MVYMAGKPFHERVIEVGDEKFQAWMREVDAAMEAEVGMGHADLPDWNYRDAFDDGMDAADAADEALAEAGW
jgi:hypothetical protein